MLKNAKRRPATKLTVRNFIWGCAFTGTKRQLLRSGLVKKEHFPVWKKQFPNSKVPMEWMRPDGRECSMQWQRDDVYCVGISHSIEDRDTSAKMAAAYARLQAVVSHVSSLMQEVRMIRPPFLSRVIKTKIPAAGGWGTPWEDTEDQAYQWKAGGYVKAGTEKS